MLKPLAITVLLAASQPALAATWSYDFSGTLGNHFDHMWDEPAPSTVFQAAGQLLFHTQGVAMSSTNELFVYRDFMPTYQQSWTAQLGVQVPLNLDTQTRTGNEVFFNVGAALLAYTTNPDGSVRNGMSISLESNPPDGHQYWSGTLGEDFVGDQPTSDVAGTLWLSFDAATKLMSAYSAYGTVLSVDIGDAANGWAMNGSDNFYIAVGFSSENMVISEAEALSLDNFSATLQPVPEPETYALMLAGLGLVGFAARRKRRT